MLRLCDGVRARGRRAERQQRWRELLAEDDHLSERKRIRVRNRKLRRVHADFRKAPRGAAMQLVRNVLQECGRLLAVVPDQSTLAQELDVVEAALASEHTPDWIEKKCLITAVVTEILVRRAGAEHAPADDVLDILKHVTDVEDEEEEISAAEMSQPNNVAAKPRTWSSEAPAISSVAENLLRVDAERIDTVLNLVGELIIAKSMMHQAINEFAKRFPKDPLKSRFSDAMAFQALDGDDLCASNRRSDGEARTCGCSIDQHGTGAALAFAATILCSGQM